MAEAALTAENLCAAVAAGHLSEAQAAGLTALAEARAGRRAAITRIDEPFELFRGFNEIFVGIGVALFLGGLFAVSPAFNAGLRDTSASAFAIWALCLSAIIWTLSEYLTRRRRMVGPSVILVCFLCFALFKFGTLGVNEALDLRKLVQNALGFAIASLGALVFYYRFRLPFALFPVGLLALAGAITALGAIDDAGRALIHEEGFRAFWDVRAGTYYPIVTLVFGAASFVVAMAYDLRDPNRVTRFAACGFWLHMLAAPAIVNTAATSLYFGGGSLAMVGLVLFVSMMALVALIIDRRSFLLSGVGYLAILLAEVRDANGPSVAIFVGLLILALGAGWTGLRGRLMRALPAFPGKPGLPPYAEAPA